MSGMSEAEKVVESLLDPESPDPKEMANDLKAEHDNGIAELRALGVVSPKTVAPYSTIYHHILKNADGTAARAKVTSVNTWKRRPDYFEIGWKRGMYEFGKITPSNAIEWTTNEPPPVPRQRRR
jgi:hypothetical protein